MQAHGGAGWNCDFYGFLQRQCSRLGNEMLKINRKTPKIDKSWTSNSIKLCQININLDSQRG
jgi:hypothetical protein